MDRKFYVSLEAARLLKEKGYNECISTFYNEDGLLLEVVAYYNLVFLAIEELNNDHYPAITKDEAIDWLESNGIMIDIHWIRFNENRRWNYSIFTSTCDIIDSKYIYLTRLEAEEAAIIKALELL